MLTVNELVELAQEVDNADPIDWGYLNVNEEQAYRLMAAGMLDYFNTLDTDEDRIKMLLATAVKLSVENFVLNLKLIEKY